FATARQRAYTFFDDTSEPARVGCAGPGLRVGNLLRTEHRMNARKPMRRLITGGLLIAVGTSMGMAMGMGAAAAYTAPFSTPAGITLVDVVKLMDGAAGTVASPQF